MIYWSYKSLRKYLANNLICITRKGGGAGVCEKNLILVVFLNLILVKTNPMKTNSGDANESY